jgi:hypothetical protein
LQAKLREIDAKFQEMQRIRRGPEDERDDLRRLRELEKALLQARQAGGSEEEIIARIQNQIMESRQHTDGRPVRRPAATSVMRAPEEVERLKGAVRELNGQVNELRREMAEIRQLLEKLAEQKLEDRHSR